MEGREGSKGQSHKEEDREGWSGMGNGARHAAADQQYVPLGAGHIFAAPVVSSIL